MKLVAIIAGVIFLLGVLVAGCIAVVNDDDSMGRVVLTSHRYEDPCDEYGDCEDGGGDYQGGPSGGRYEGGRGGENDQRGDHNCRNFCFYGVPLPGQQPESLFPPTPTGVRDFVLAVTKSGIEMGRLFADTTITFVSDLLVGLA